MHNIEATVFVYRNKMMCEKMGADGYGTLAVAAAIRSDHD
jgi:hypothetical protein